MPAVDGWPSFSSGSWLSPCSCSCFSRVCCAASLKTGGKPQQRGSTRRDSRRLVGGGLSHSAHRDARRERTLWAPSRRCRGTCTPQAGAAARPATRAARAAAATAASAQTPAGKETAAAATAATAAGLREAAAAPGTPSCSSTYLRASGTQYPGDVGSCTRPVHSQSATLSTSFELRRPPLSRSGQTEQTRAPGRLRGGRGDALDNGARLRGPPRAAREATDHHALAPVSPARAPPPPRVSA